MEVIKLDKVSFKYDHDWILKDIDLSVKKKDFLGIVGPNGGGKTTLLKIILGLLKPNKGKLTVNGILSYVPQHLNFDKYHPVCVEDVVLMGLLDKMSAGLVHSKEDHQKAYSVMKTLGIYEIKKQRFGELSGGQRQRVLIARAIISNPDILILDEPTANIDKAAQDMVQKLLVKLNEKMTLLMVSHHFDFISSDVNRVVCINKTIHTHPTYNIAGKNISIIDHSGDTTK
jgi:zinc transport system ATP-binding protein